jgi:class 3 adenylate cyclase
VGASVPSWTVTFLFCDVEGSTRLREAHGEEMRTALGVHDQIVRHAFESAGGLVFATGGDGFGAAFSGPGRRWLRRWPPSAAWPPRTGLTGSL